MAPAQRSKAALTRVARHWLDDDSPLHRFATLLGDLATIVRSICRAPNAAPDAPTFELVTTLNAEPQRALDLIQEIQV